MTRTEASGIVSPMSADRATIRLVTFGLVLLSVVGMVGMIGLTALDKPIPDALTALTSAAAGALAALLARTTSIPDPPVEVV